jgi:Zn-dependent peptidase ImmA (M78 family)
MPARRTTAERNAHELLTELGITTIPISVEAVAAGVGARIIEQTMDAEISGLAYRQADTARIGVNASHHERRRRFTIAHEIGHLRLHPGRPLTVDSSIRVNFRDTVSSQATDNEEIEANAFAAALLMPASVLQKRVAELGDAGRRSRENLIRSLAADFDVSTEAMGYRLMNLGIITSH